jgi:hypothetical protein
MSKTHEVGFAGCFLAEMNLDEVTIGKFPKALGVQQVMALKCGSSEIV